MLTVNVSVEQKRPPGRRLGETLPLRLTPELTAEVDTWREAQPDRPSRSEAIRRLVERGLKAS
jgi:hypothetical protein